VNILVVDDDHSLCVMLSRYLEKHGFRVFSAGDALQALDVLGREQIDMVITDYQMPYLDGIGLTEQLKADERYKDLPVILITGNPSDEISERGLRKGVAMMLSKPIDFERLLTLIRFAQ
jgi:CheY-like chemotaxis protein